MIFVDTKLTRSSVSVGKIECGDAVHLVRSSATDLTSAITDSMADAIDTDFSDIDFESISISSAGDDCLDVSQGRYRLKKEMFANLEDKRIPVGKDAQLIANRLVIRKAGIGIASKNGACVFLRDIKVLTSQFALGLYKKFNFSPPHMSASVMKCDSCKQFVENNLRIEGALQ